MTTELEILRGLKTPRPDSFDELRVLWFAVYDGPVAWEGRSAFEQIVYLNDCLRKLKQ